MLVGGIAEKEALEMDGEALRGLSGGLKDGVYLLLVAERRVCHADGDMVLADGACFR